MWSTYQLQIAKKSLETKVAEAKKNLELKEYWVRVSFGLSTKEWIPFSWELDEEKRSSHCYQDYLKARNAWWSVSGRLEALEKQLKVMAL